MDCLRDSYVLNIMKNVNDRRDFKVFGKNNLRNLIIENYK